MMPITKSVVIWLAFVCLGHAGLVAATPLALPYPDPFAFPDPVADPQPYPDPDPFPGPYPEANPFPEAYPEPDAFPGPNPNPGPFPGPMAFPNPNPYPQPNPAAFPDPAPTPNPEPYPNPAAYPGPEPMPEPVPEPVPEPIRLSGRLPASLFKTSSRSDSGDGLENDLNSDSPRVIFDFNRVARSNDVDLSDVDVHLYHPSSLYLNSLSNLPYGYFYSSYEGLRSHSPLYLPRYFPNYNLGYNAFTGLGAPFGLPGYGVSNLQPFLYNLGVSSAHAAHGYTFG